MKTPVTFFALLTTVTLVSGSVFAAGAREVRTKTAETKEVKSDAIASLRGHRTTEQVFRKASQELGRISSGRAAEADFRAAFRLTVDVYTGNSGRKLNLYEVGKSLLKLDEIVREFRNSGKLTRDGKLHVDALEQAVQTGAEFLAMAASTSATTQLASKIDANDRGTLNLFNKQLSILMELGSMEKADLQAHTAVMKAAVARKKSAKEEGDKVFAASLGLDYAKDNTKKLEKVAEDLINCR